MKKTHSNSSIKDINIQSDEDITFNDQTKEPSCKLPPIAQNSTNKTILKKQWTTQKESQEYNDVVIENEKDPSQPSGLSQGNSTWNIKFIEKMQ